MKLDGTIPIFGPSSWLIISVFIALFIAVEGTSCPVSCVCPGNSSRSIICKDVTVVQWPDICNEVNVLFTKEHLLLDVHLSGDTSNSTLPKLDLGCLPPLRNLDVSFIAFDFDGLSSVNVTETLSLTHNAIKYLPEDAFSSQGGINSLNLSHNDIDDLKAKTFSSLYSLQMLDLSFNDIKSIPPALLQSLTNLTTIDFGHNEIEHITSYHLPLSSNLKVFSINDNNLKSFYIGENESDATSLNKLKYLDISNNPLECSCILQKVLHKITTQGGVIANGDNTLCQSPPPMANMSVTQLNETDLICSHPHSLMSFPSKKKAVLYTSTITLECRAEAYPSPHIMWITPWGDKFSTAPLGLIVHKHLADEDKINIYRKYEERNVMMTSSIKVTERNNLVISHFRGSMTGNFSCVAFNEIGVETKVIQLTVHSMLKSSYVTSLKIASFCASGCLIIGFLIGFINILVQKLRHRVCFKVPLFTPAASVRPAVTDGAPSIYSDLSPPMSPLLASCSENSIDYSAHYHDLSGGDLSPEKRPRPIFDTIGDAKEKLRDGVGRKMETVRRNVQSIKESTGAAVHTIMERGSSAANTMKAGVAMGVETVKLHVQSVKELCGTGNMGAHTVSIVSMETDIDTNQQKSLVRQVTFV